MGEAFALKIHHYHQQPLVAGQRTMVGWPQRPGADPGLPGSPDAAVNS